MPSTNQSTSSRRRLVSGVVLMLVVTAAFVFGDPKAWLQRALAAVAQLGPWGPLVFATVYIVATVLLVPGSALTLAAGALFGVAWGMVIVSLASTVAAVAAFLIGRFLARDFVAARTARNPAFAALDRALGRDGWKIVALARLSPAFPYTLLNYAFGLTRVRFTHYVLTSWLAMLPGTLLYVYLGSLANAGARVAEKTPFEWALYAVGFAATIAVTVVISRGTRRAIKEAGLAPDTRAEETANARPPRNGGGNG